jgi:fructosamine-3-kinase
MIYSKILEEKLDEKIGSFSALSGGDINEVFKINTSRNTFVVKINVEKRFPQMFEKEKAGLNLLGETGIKTPDVIAVFSSDKMQFLVLEFIEEERKAPQFWTNFATNLAKLHKNRSEFYGLETDNYIGSLVQKNSKKTTWIDFFIENRIAPLIKKAFDQGLLQTNHMQQFENLFQKLHEIIPQEKPSLVHGDLWSGNLMVGKNQFPVFIDPAVYYGHREMDIAMTQLFGGFDNKYLEIYNEIYPLEKGWQERIVIHNLYPNLVHLLLFGSSYLFGIESVLGKFH